MNPAAASLHVQVTKKLALTFVACALLLTGLAPSQAASDEASRLVSVIVQGISPASVEDAVESVGGDVTRTLPIVAGVAAEVPAAKVRQLKAAGYWVTPNSTVRFHKAFDGSKTAHQLDNVLNSTKLVENGIDGSGVTVALLDTGVYPHADLGSRVVHCEDFSHERGTEAHCADTFGHGTFMAGLIAGNGASSGGKYVGAAPAANIVSVKLAGFDGSTDVSNVLAGIQWTVSHKDTYGIRVMNLSLGSDSAQDYRMSPLNFAVEKAWESGVVVVVSAGNTGPNGSTVTKPGDDPWVITVGAENHEGTVDIKDDWVPVFSGRGPTRSNGLAKPDVVAPGVHTVSLRSPGSAVDQKYCETACVGGAYFKGTGTSMGTALATGTVAQILEANPGLDPNQVKFRLMATARPIALTDVHAVGKGLIDAYAAATSISTEMANQGLEKSTGLGLLGDARGSIGIDVTTPVASAGLSGEFTTAWDGDLVDLTNPLGLVTFDAVTYTTIGWDASNWAGSNWAGSNWAGSNWAGSNWAGSNWAATAWTGSNWAGSNWANADWDGSNWAGSNWAGVDWDASNWAGSNWASKWYAAAWD